MYTSTKHSPASRHVTTIPQRRRRKNKRHEILVLTPEEEARAREFNSHPPGYWREQNARMYPVTSTDISQDKDLAGFVRTRWLLATSNECKMIETLLRAHPNIEDHTVRIYVGLRRGCMPKAEW
jgi:hypothetical protein